jgi:hypothetical protein
MSQHEAFLKAIRVEPNDPFHQRIYCDFLRDEGRDPDQFLPIARLLAEHLHSAKQNLYLPRYVQIGRFGVEVLISCTHLTALREIHLPGRRVVEGDTHLTTVRVEPNIGQDGVILLAGSPLLQQIRVLDVRYNALGPDAVDALVKSPWLGELERLDIDEPPNILPPAAWDRLMDHFGDRLRRGSQGW